MCVCLKAEIEKHCKVSTISFVVNLVYTFEQSLVLAKFDCISFLRDYSFPLHVDLISGLVNLNVELFLR